MTLKQLQTKLEELEALIYSGKDYAQTESQARELLNILPVGDEVGDIELHCRTLLVLANSLWRRSIANEALSVTKEALVLAENTNNIGLQAVALNTLGTVYFKLSKYIHSLEIYLAALSRYEELNDNVGTAIISGNIGMIYAELSDYDCALEYYNRALSIYNMLGDISMAASVNGNIGNMYRYQLNYARALEYFEIALSAHTQVGNRASAAIVTGGIGCVYLSISDYTHALNYLTAALAAHEELEMKSEAASALGNIGLVYARDDYEGYNPLLAEELLLKALLTLEEVNAKGDLNDIHKYLANLYKKQKRWKKCQSHFEKSYELEKELQIEEAKKQAERLDYVRKTAEREKQFAVEQAKHEATQELLYNVLPKSIAQKMLQGTRLIAEKLPCVSVLFADVVNFTKLSQRISPEELVEGLDNIFSTFDILAEKHGLEKIKTIGDAYMVVSGAPLQRSDHVDAIARFAIEMVESIKEFSLKSTGEKIHLRIGIHSGEVVAGVIGKKKFAYDLWGDAVNTASRMESHGEPGKIHCTEEFMKAVGESSFHFIERGEMEIKGKGIMKTYFLERADGNG